ncbi:MAG: protein translocase subunit SecD [bacterium]|nr:protein translocase subunit SecD [bacterium]MBU1917306.1 protein translocase subunit SecD [bacterium]
MSGTWKFKFTLLVMGLLVAIYMLIPTLSGMKDNRVSLEKAGTALPWYYTILPEKELNLGLDLRGGLYMEMEVGVDGAMKHHVDAVVTDINRLVLGDYDEDLKAASIGGNIIRLEIIPGKKSDIQNNLVGDFGNKTFEIQRDHFEVFYTVKSDAKGARKKAIEALNALDGYEADVTLTHNDKYIALPFSSTEQKSKIIEILSTPVYASDFVIADQAAVPVSYVLLSSFHINSKRREIIEQAANSVRNRIDRFGVAEASVSRQAGDRLVIELPGVKDPDQVIQVIRRTGKLEFRIVDDSVTHEEVGRLVNAKAKELNIERVYEEGNVKIINEALKAELPQDSEIVYHIVRDPQSKKVASAVPYLLEKKADVTGDMLDNASVQTQNNLPYVSMVFNKSGTKKFGKVTSDNVGRLLAIVLDGVVSSAPVIKGPIMAGQAQIELGLGRYEDLIKEAKETVMVLKEGALPATLTVATKNIIGPSLGKDSIEAGLNSLMIAAIAVLLFMLLYYKVGGLVANIALIVNVVLIFGILTLFQASLTLPGIAGIVLTIGMAVDANVIIFERMREEQYLGQDIAMVVESGYGNAMSAIIDSNITTFISALVLFEFGTGPIKGFATTLMIGIVTTLITAIVLTRVIYDFMIHKMHVKTLKI